MDNRKVGFLLFGAVAVMVLIIFIFNNALVEIVNSSCSVAGHGDTCPMYNTVKTQTNLALALAAMVAIVSLYLIFSKPQEKIIIKTKTVHKSKSSKTYDTSNLKPEEKTVFKLVKESKTIFQADLIDKTSFGKAKMTRILDRLEGQGFLERKRRGMTNVVVLKE